MTKNMKAKVKRELCSGTRLPPTTFKMIIIQENHVNTFIRDNTAFKICNSYRSTIAIIPL